MTKSRFGIKAKHIYRAFTGVGDMTKSRFGIKAKLHTAISANAGDMTKSRFGIKAKPTAYRPQVPKI